MTKHASSSPERGEKVRERVPVAVLGATGSVGQRFVSLLAGHPWFELAALGASDRSAGRTYGEVVRWLLPEPIPERAARIAVRPAGDEFACPLVFSALDAEVAGPIELAHAATGRLVVTNARSHRMEPGVPLLVPEVNADHLALLGGRGPGPGRIVANPNCSAIGLALALKPLDDAFGLECVHVVTLQAISGAGRSGPSALELADNLIPYIAGEEEKIERETQKILGRLGPTGLAYADVAVSAQCNRVPVLEGHVECVSVGLRRGATARELIDAWEGFRGAPQDLALPSAPVRPVRYLDAFDAPQPRLHRELDRGMSTVIGRLRPCPLLGWKFVLCTHNTLRGAAGGALLSAELLLARGILAGLPQAAVAGQRPAP